MYYTPHWGQSYHTSLGVTEVGEWTARGVPTILAPTPITAVITDLIVHTTRKQGNARLSPPTFQPMQAMKELFLWLRDRMTFQQATQLIVHLATYMCKRKPKAQQIYIDAEPDAGKTTLYNLLTKTFKKRTFSVSAESKSFMAAAFDDRSKDAIWLEDEFNAYLFWSFHQKHIYFSVV